MAFQIKNFVSIVGGMINHVRGVAPALTDFNRGAIIRTLLEAPAVEIEECYQQAFNGLREAIPVATYGSFNFERLPAAPASGVLVVTVVVSTNDVVIRAGTVFSTTSSRTTYISQADVTILAGTATGIVSVIAADVGIIGNVPVSTVFSAVPKPLNYTTATNALRFNNGRELESDDERKQRFISYIETIQRGTNAALEYGAKTAALFNTAGIETERVKVATVIEPWVTDGAQPISLVQVYVHNGVGATTGGLVTQASTILHGYVDPTTGLKVPGWKAAGVKVDVYAAAEVLLHCLAKITAAPGYASADLATAANDVLSKYVLSLDIGAPFVMSTATVLVSEIEGVANVVFEAVSGAPLWALSSSSITAGTGTKVFTVGAGLGFTATTVVQAIRLADLTSRMIGTVTTYTGTTLTTSMVQAAGSGAHSDWIVTLFDADDVSIGPSSKFMPGTLDCVGL